MLYEEEYEEEYEDEYEDNYVAEEISHKNTCKKGKKPSSDVNSIMKIFARNMRYYMDVHSLSLKDIERELGISNSTARYWEKGEKYPDLKNLVGLANLFGVSPDILIAKDGNNAGEQSILNRRPEMKRLINVVKDRDKAAIEGLLSFIKRWEGLR